MRAYAAVERADVCIIMIDGKEVELKAFAKSNTASDPTAVASAMHQKQIENLLLAIEGKAKVLVDCSEGKKAVKIITDIYSN